MARTPSLTTTEAETLLGSRGTLRVTAENCGTVRKWLTSQGFPAMFAVGLSMAELAISYNTVDGSGLEKLRKKLSEGEANGLADEPENAPAARAVAPDAASLLRDLLLQDYTPGLDENQVRAIVQELIAGVAPRVIEVRHPDKAPIKIEGLVHPEFERALHYLSTIGPNGYRTNVMLVGPAGCGKSHLIKQLAKALDVRSTIVGGTAGVTEGDLIGRLLPGDGGRFEYRPSRFIQLYEEGDALLAFDEIDGFDPNMLMVANMPLANGSMFVHLRPDNPEVRRGKRVHFMATANTFGTGANPIYVGRNPMDEATRDRFMFITVDYDKRLESSSRPRAV